MDCSYGPREIIRPDVNGLLVANCDLHAIAEAVKRLMCDAELRLRLASRAPEIVQRFDARRIVDTWERLLIKVGEQV